MEVDGIDEDYYNNFTDKSPYEKEPVKQCVPGTELQSMANGCFDCNICLDFATDPVVTLCGHLYCWPCIHKWLRIKSTSSCRCPVCKAVLSMDSLVPLYGRGFTKKVPKQSLDDVPQRPQFISQQQPSMQGVQSQHHYQYDNYLHYYDGNMSESYMSPYWPTETRVFRSTAGEVLEGLAVAVLPWMFRNYERVYNTRSHLSTASTYTSRQQMRQEMQAQKLLSQIWSFLFFFSILCLLLF